MSTFSCPKCGSNNLATARYCMTCGTPLAPPPAPAQPSYQTPQQQSYPSAQPPAQPYYSYPPNYRESQRQSRIDNTKTGLLLLMIGSLLSWVPFVGAVGGLIALIGAIFIIIGREAFGHHHERNVISSIIIFCVGIGVFAVGFVALFFAAFSNAIANPGSPSSLLQPGWYTVLLLIAAVIWGIAEVLFTYSLQNSTGRLLLWTGFVLGIITGLVNALIILPATTVTSRFSLYTGNFLITAVLAAPTALLYGIAFYMARERIERREIPPIATQLGTPASSPLH